MSQIALSNSPQKRIVSNTVQNLATLPEPTFWPLSDRVTAVQVHTAADVKLLKRKFQAETIAYSCFGRPLEVLRVNRSIEMGSGWVTALLPTAKRVWGGDHDLAPETTHAAIHPPVKDRSYRNLACPISGKWP